MTSPGGCATLQVGPASTGPGSSVRAFFGAGERPMKEWRLHKLSSKASRRSFAFSAATSNCPTGRCSTPCCTTPSAGANGRACRADCGSDRTAWTGTWGHCAPNPTANLRTGSTSSTSSASTTWPSPGPSGGWRSPPHIPTRRSRRIGRSRFMRSGLLRHGPLLSSTVAGCPRCRWRRWRCSPSSPAG